MTIYDIISRAKKLREETRLDSISPDRVGALIEDTLKYINAYQLLASSPALHKVYQSVAHMQSDAAPQSDLTGNALRVGQLVVIVPTDQADPTAGDVYRYDGPSGNTSAWTFVAKIGGVPADSTFSSTSTNPLQNKVITEKFAEVDRDKQEALVSGENIKTINGESILGKGNITLQGGGTGEGVGNIDPELLEAYMPLSRDFSDDFNNDFTR